jgi:hypothetical protein
MPPSLAASRVAGIGEVEQAAQAGIEGQAHDRDGIEVGKQSPGRA